MRLLFNPKCIEALKVVAAATLTSDVDLSPSLHLKDHPAVLATGSYTVITSQNAIVCRLFRTDATDGDICKFLLWEATVLNPTIRRHITGQVAVLDKTQCIMDIDAVLSALEAWFNNCGTIFTLEPLSACAVVLWANLLPLLHPQSPFGPSVPDSLRHFFSNVEKNLNSDNILAHFMGSSSDIQTFWPSLQTGPSGTHYKHVSEQHSKAVDVTSKQKGKGPQKKLSGGEPTTHVANGPIINTSSDGDDASTFSVTDEDLNLATDGFHPIGSFKRPVYPSPKCPLPRSSGVRNILITSALPYVNNVPHLGNMIGSTLSANVFALYCEIAGYNVLSICGTDEYGTATEAKALAENLTAKQICDKYYELHCTIYNWFDIRFDYFGRTTTEKHVEIVQDLFMQLWENDYITEDTVEQLFCVHCSKFLADRFVEGECPFCKYNDARGDQCDKCSRLMNAIELRQPRCKICLQSPEIRSSKHLFLNLPKLEKQLTEFIEHRTTDSTSLWSANARTISLGWLRDGLKSRCITRDLKWGVPVPLDAFKNKVFYVWFDAPVGYMSITANYTKQWRCWWQPSDSADNDDVPNVELFQFMAKDNVPFHSIIFPACLLGANRGYTVVRHLLATEYMNYEGTKFSKSRGLGVFGNDAMKSGIDSNIWRFYLLYRRPETQDSSFMWDDFMLVNNSELLNNVGNFVHRALSFVSRFFNSEVPTMTNLEQSDIKFIAQVNQLIRSYANHFESGRLREALRQILSIARLGNCYVQANQPWVAVKSEETKPKASAVITVAANVACLIGLLLYPFMPTIAGQIWCTQCNLPLDSLSLVPLSRQDYRMPQFLSSGHRIAKPTPLFRKIDTEEVNRLSQRFNGTQECNSNEAA